MNIYIGCGLTHVPRIFFNEYCDTIHCLAKHLSDKFDHKIKYALVDSDPQLSSIPFERRAEKCYNWDKSMVENADLILAEVSFPSLGLGIELGLAEVHKTPIILFFKDYGVNKAEDVVYLNPDGRKNNLQIGEGYVSLMALGIPSVKDVIKYDSFNSLTERIALSLNSIRSNLSHKI